MPVGLDDLQGAYQSAHLLEDQDPRTAMATAATHAGELAGTGPCAAAVAAAHPLLLAARVHRAVRSGSAFSDDDMAVLDAAVVVAAERCGTRREAS